MQLPALGLKVSLLSSDMVQVCVLLPVLKEESQSERHHIAFVLGSKMSWAGPICFCQCPDLIQGTYISHNLVMWGCGEESGGAEAAPKILFTGVE